MCSPIYAPISGNVNPTIEILADDRCYEHYDIVIWSQTHWRWLESKLVELGIVGGEYNYKISFVLDRLPMFPVFTLRTGGEMQKHEVKPLQYIWTQFPQWGQHNVCVASLASKLTIRPYTLMISLETLP